MADLIITLKGEIQNSNFDEWKGELIARIRSVNTDLVRDEDFARASDQVKLFKNAERSLKQAKQSAIAQAADIQRLFDSIDAVAEETRQVRLTLERRIKARKQEIKEQMIEGGINAVHAAIARQSAAFQTLEHAPFLDRARFEKTAKGKSTSRTLAKAIEALVRQIEQEIAEEGLRVAENIAILDSIADEHRLLFQDRDHLIRLPKSEVRLTIDKRIAQYHEAAARKRAEQATAELQRIDDQDLNPPDACSVPMAQAAKERYRITIELSATREHAIELARIIREAHSDDESVASVRLSRVRE